MRTSSLFHFTKNWSILEKILQERSFWPRFCDEDLSWIRSERTYAAFAMTCFCDIPITRLLEHTSSYGEYGIGLTKAWGCQEGLNPVIYLNNCSPLKKCLQRLFKHADHHYEALGRDAYREAIELAAYVKPYEGFVRINGKETLKRFYDECEWRYVPHGVYANTDYFFGSTSARSQVEMDKLNARTKRNPLKFGTSDIRYLFVPSRSHVADLVVHIRDVFTGQPEAEINSLLTKVVALDEIRQDI